MLQSANTAGQRMEQRLSSTPASELDTFIEDHLLPNTDFRTEVSAAIDTISDFLKKNCYQVRVSKVVKVSPLSLS